MHEPANLGPCQREFFASHVFSHENLDRPSSACRKASKSKKASLHKDTPSWRCEGPVKSCMGHRLSF